MRVVLLHSSANHNETLAEQIAHYSHCNLPIDQLLKKEKSLFEMVNVCLDVEVGRHIARELLVSPYFSFHEVSHSLDFSPARSQEVEWQEKQQEVSVVVRQAYTWAINHGISKEQAMKILPESMISSKIYMNGSLWGWIQYIREHNPEHRLFVLECVRTLEPLFPLIKTLCS